MPDLRTSAALRQLPDLCPGPRKARWRWAVARVEPTGRLILPAEARAILGVVGAARGTCNRVAFLLRPTAQAPRWRSTAEVASGFRHGCGPQPTPPAASSSAPGVARRSWSWRRPACSMASATFWSGTMTDRPQPPPRRRRPGPGHGMAPGEERHRTRTTNQPRPLPAPTRPRHQPGRRVRSRRRLRHRSRHGDERAPLQHDLRPRPPCLVWADRTPVSAHVLRHTAITAVGRLTGYPVAQAFAGHTPPSVTGTYLRATINDVATAIATLTGLPHPLAHRDHSRGSRCGRR
jgi:hypothetical protein